MWSPGITLAQVHSSLIGGVTLLPILTRRRGPNEKKPIQSNKNQFVPLSFRGCIVRSEGRKDEKLPKVNLSSLECIKQKMTS
ncbi:hypothetical protein ASPFODRAFT_147900 [Aspergillus luchuensis CBS 106.47]|uniref:Uncharacterized protein n=1 Tax=Aspergillus luchuensis (strain CBS 106.47) TaxID=1137211 RepID=A0A1M3T191_ASPLC|nr:hypothetical protein ASPFODRAFT_147900 [Aspergillus luchuensis CBS 106.47]